MGASASVTDAGTSTVEARAWDALCEVEDPEIPVLTLVDLGVIRYVHVDAAGGVKIGLSPTYSGCPATATIRASIVEVLRAAGFKTVQVLEVLSPAWSSDWLSEQGREKLRRYGIAPPLNAVNAPRHLMGAAPQVPCPHCACGNTMLVSAFGSTPCKALYRCETCLEPFEYFKCL